MRRPVLIATLWAIAFTAIALSATAQTVEPRVTSEVLPSVLMRQTHRGALLAAYRHGHQRFLGSNLDQDVILRYLEGARPIRFKPVGSTSIVYEMVLDGPVNAAFKPGSRHRPGGAIAEVAAYRIARLLGMDNVPPAVTRWVRRDDIQSRLHPDYADAWDEIVDWTLWDDQGRAAGAAIYWVPEMRSLGLESDSSIRRWTRRLKQGGPAIQDDERAMYTDLSRMLVLDYLIGNWDRWSGGNAQGMPDGSRLFTRDHDMAFGSPLAANLHRRVFDHLLRAEHFSRSQIDRLLAMNEPALRTELRQDPGAASGMTLDDGQIAGVMDRRRAVISYVVALIDQYGEDRVLSLP